MTPAELARFLREEVPHLRKRANGLYVFAHHDILALLDSLDCAMGLLTSLTLAVGDDPDCAKLTVSCTCGKAAQLAAAHQEAAYVVRGLAKRDHVPK